MLFRSLNAPCRTSPPPSVFPRGLSMPHAEPPLPCPSSHVVSQCPLQIVPSTFRLPRWSLSAPCRSSPPPSVSPRGLSAPPADPPVPRPSPHVVSAPPAGLCSPPPPQVPPVSVPFVGLPPLSLHPSPLAIVSALREAPPAPHRRAALTSSASLPASSIIRRRPRPLHAAPPHSAPALCRL